MDVFKVIGIGMVSLIIIIIIKQYKPEFAVYVSIIASIIILFAVMDKLSGIVDLLKSFVNKSGINNTYLAILLKITGIAVLTEFGVSICKDSGEAAIANKIDFAGRIIIIGISIPIITALLEVILDVLP